MIATEEGTKVCRVCERTLGRDQFYARPEAQDGLRNDCKDCVKARSALREKSKPEEVKATKAAWMSRPEVQRRISESKRRYYDANRDLVIERSRQWVEQHPEQRKQTWQEWYRSNPEARHRSERTRRAAKAQADRRAVLAKDWARLVGQYRGLCAYCGTSPWKHRDHIIPLSRGGRHSIGNLLPACEGCNLSKGSSTLMEWRLRKLRVTSVR